MESANETEPKLIINGFSPAFRSRQRDKSLSYLTAQFVELMKSQKLGILDIRQAAELLGITQKRRIYDITNVLEGIGLIKKANKNCVQWCGFIEEQRRTPNIEAQILREERMKLRKEEDIIDFKLKLIKQNIRITKACEVNKSFSYVTRDDFVNVYGLDSVTVVLKNVKKSYFRVHENPVITLPVHFLSESGRELDVRLVSTDSETFLPKSEVNAIESDEEPSIPTTVPTVLHTDRPSVEETANGTRSNCDPADSDSDSDDTRERKALAKQLFRRPFTKELSKFSRKRRSNVSVPYRPYNVKEADHTYMKEEGTPFAVDALRRIEPANGCDYSFSLKASREGVLDLYDVDQEY